MMVSNEYGFGSATIKVVKFSEDDIFVYEEFTRKVTFFTMDDPRIHVMRQKRRNTYKKAAGNGAGNNNEDDGSESDTEMNF